ncbi:MAG: glycosyltransferase family 39 protein, partial [Longimicrobiales bacterium]
LLAAMAAVPSADPVAYALELVASSVLQAVHLCTALLAVQALPTDTVARLAAWLDRPCEHGVPGEILFAAAAVTVVAALLCVFVYEAHPHVPDEVVYLLPARYFADGVLTLAAPPVADAFDVDLMANDGVRWYSPVPPGWPAILAIGSFFGVPWLVNPVLGGLAVLLTWQFVSKVYDARTGRLAALMLASSPWLLFLSMSFMTHLLTLTCALFASTAVERARRMRAPGSVVLGGAAIGWIGLTRPLDAVATAVVLGFYLLWTGTTRLRIGSTLLLAVSSLAVSALTLPYNRIFTGSPTTFPLMAYTDAQYGEGTNALGFGANRGIGWPGLDPFPGHGAIDVVLNAVLNVSTINIELLGWATGSLLLVALVGVSRRWTTADLATLGAAAFVAGLHSFYWFSGGPDFGARYWFLAIVPLVVLAARGAVLWDAPRNSPGPLGGRTAATFVLLSVVTVVTFVPWRSFDKYHHYRGMEAGIRRLAEAEGFGRDLVFIRGDRHPDYASAAFYNPLDWNADAPIYAWDRSPSARREVLAAYPDRAIWFVEGPTVTGSGYRVAEGPFAAGSLAGDAGP